MIPSINSLHKEKGIKELAKIKIFDNVLNRCVEKIIFTNKYTDKTFVIFEVPQIIIGHPNYDYKICILYLMSQLTQKHYKVSFLEPFYIYIDWGSEVINTTSSKHSIDNNDKLKKQTKELLKKFPNASKVEFVYENKKNSK
jgi:hypothetical protein